MPRARYVSFYDYHGRLTFHEVRGDDWRLAAQFDVPAGIGGDELEAVIEAHRKLLKPLDGASPAQAEPRRQPVVSPLSTHNAIANAMAALRRLGFRDVEARRKLANVDPGATAEEMVRFALAG